MNWKNSTIIILLIINICMFSAHGENTESFQGYDLMKSIRKAAEDINLSKNLKNVTSEDKAFLNAFQDFLPKSIQSLLIEYLADTDSEKCVDDLQYVFENISSPYDWSGKMLDSYGKPESGILLGNVKWLGHYEECLKVYAPPKENNTEIGDFHGKYCTILVPLKFGSTEFTLSSAVCLPDSCNPNATFNGLFKNLTVEFNMTEEEASILNNATITCKANTMDITAGFIVVVTLLSVISLLAVIGSSITVLEHYLIRRSAKKSVNEVDISSLNGDVEQTSNDDVLMISRSKENILPAWLVKCKPFFNCFCILTNGEKILNTDSAEGQLPCLHGIRFLSMTWVILCHCNMGAANFVKYPLGSVDVIDGWSYQIILNGFFSVDSFFVLSGFLVGYVYFQQATKSNGKIPWLYFYVHRYIRLTPVYMLVLAFYTSVSPYLGSGPLWPEGNVIQACEDNWWWNLLYINNFKDPDYVCMGWSWYLANDMQFYVISPLFLITLYKWPKIGYSFLGLFFCITFTSNFALTYEYDLIAGFGNIVEYADDYQSFLPRFSDFYTIIYIKPYTRVGSYVVGLLVAHIVYKWKQNNCKKLSTVSLVICWILSTGITLACQFGLYHQKLSTVETAFYNAFGRTGFSLGIGWVIFVCVIGQGDVVNSILSWNALIPLSRLTFTAYLVHPLVVMTYINSMNSLLVYNHINMIMLFLGSLFLSYAAALITSLILESPVIRLERLLRNKLSS